MVYALLLAARDVCLSIGMPNAQFDDIAPPTSTIMVPCCCCLWHVLPMPLLTYQAMLTASSNLRQSALHYQGFFICTRSQCSPCGSLAAVLTVTGPLEEGCIL